MNWRQQIIGYTEFPEARTCRIDSTFFTPTPATALEEWESDHSVSIPEQLRSYMLFSNGLEAQRGEIWPILPLGDWELLPQGCALPVPWIRFGTTKHFRYCLSLGHSPSIYRHERLGSETEFFAPSVISYLEKIFRNQGEAHS